MVWENGRQAVIVVKDGSPTDADFTTPVDGLVVFDRVGNKVWFRLNGLWKGVELP